MQEGYIHSIETAGMVDGPGIRYVIFFQGCNLRCLYCHNPDTWETNKGSKKSITEILSDIKGYRSYMNFSGGGVTITGGEPLLQPYFLINLLKEMGKQGYHRALDTSGYATDDILRQVLSNVDLLLLDIKAIEPNLYKKITGVEIDRSLRALEIAKEMNLPVWVRFVLVPGLTDDEEHLHKLRDFVHSYPNVEKFHLFPFHKMGEYKWDDLGLEYTLADTPRPTEEEKLRVRRILGAEIQ